MPEIPVLTHNLNPHGCGLARMDCSILLNFPLKGINISSTELCSSVTTCRHFSLNDSRQGLSSQISSFFSISDTVKLFIKCSYVNRDWNLFRDITSETGVSVCQYIQTSELGIFRYMPTISPTSFVLVFMDVPFFLKLFSFLFFVRTWIMSSDTNFWKYSSGVWRETGSLVKSRPEKSVLGLIKFFFQLAMPVTGLGLCAWMAWFYWPDVHIIIRWAVRGFLILLLQFTGIFIFITSLHIPSKIQIHPNPTESTHSTEVTKYCLASILCPLLIILKAIYATLQST